MKKIRIENLRSLIDTDYIDVKPITVLVGKNSVGKSTFLRTFPLLKQTMTTNRSEPILWYSPELVDFGNFSESISKKTKSKSINLSYEFDLIADDFLSAPFFYQAAFELIRGMRYSIGEDDVKKVVNTKVMISITEENISKVNISVLDYKYTISIDEKGKVTNLSVNNTKSPLKIELNQSDKYTNKELIPQIDIPIENSKKSKAASYSEKTLSFFFEELESIKGKQIGSKRFRKFLEGLSLSSKQDFKQRLLNQINEFSSVKKQYEKLSEKEADGVITRLYDYYGLSCINIVISVINQYFYEYFDNCQYIAPIRATAQRNYRSQGLSIETITPQGENVPMILDSMSKKEKEDWNNWTEERFGIKFIVTKYETNISLQLEKNGEKINLADTGFGYSQLLPILLYAWKSVKRDSRKFYWTSDKRKKINTLVIEQPELHLHPALQAKVLDVFIDLVKYINENVEFNIVMETHSEAIINRLGQHVVLDKDGDLLDKINIVIFNEIDGKLKIDQSRFDKEGYLENWPVDFFLPVMEDIHQ